LTTAAQAQIQKAWVAHYNNGITNGTHQAVKMALDAAGNIYVTGFSQKSLSNLGYVTIKYAPNGNQLWAARYDSTNYPSAKPSGLVIDSSNNVIVTGSALTVKYDSNGNQLWTAPYAGTALAVDSSTYVYVTGYSTNFNTVKLSPAGSNLWQCTYVDNVGPTLSQAIAIDSNGNVYVSGSDNWYHYTFSSYVQLATIKYDTNGGQVWISLQQEGVSGVSVAGIVPDAGGNLYVEVNFTPSANAGGYFTFKYASNGVLLWTVANPTYNVLSLATELALDNGTNVLITGKARDDSIPYFYGTYKINTSGSIIWTNIYPQPPIGVSGANAIAVDSANSVYVTGYSPGTISGNDIATVKYGPNGNQVWVQRYNGPGNGNDAGNAIAVDNSGNVYVTGYDTLPGGGTEIVTIKYSAFTLQRQADGTVLLQAQGSPGESFDVQASADLQTWQDLGQRLADTNGFFQFDDTYAPQYNARFYLTLPQ
jgi:outer membrane protein assembly factor BamB